LCVSCDILPGCLLQTHASTARERLARENANEEGIRLGKARPPEASWHHPQNPRHHSNSPRHRARASRPRGEHESTAGSTRRAEVITAHLREAACEALHQAVRDAECAAHLLSGAQCKKEARESFAEAVAAIDSLYADAARHIEAAEADARRLRATLVKLCRHFPIDSDMVEAGWSSRDIAEACDAYDEARAIAETAGPDGKDSGAKGK